MSGQSHLLDMYNDQKELVSERDARIRELEAALREIAGGSAIYTIESARIHAREALAASETFVKQEPSRGDPEDDKKGHP